MSKPETIKIDDVEYVRADKQQMAEKIDGMEYCVIHTYSAGVHIGYLKSFEGQAVTLINSRRLWSWSNAASLSQIAMDGCKSNKFAMTLPVLHLTDVIEVIPCSEKAKEVLQSIPEWKHGSDSGSGYGYGYGDGSGYGDGYGDGSGYGDGYGD